MQHEGLHYLTINYVRIHGGYGLYLPNPACAKSH